MKKNVLILSMLCAAEIFAAGDSFAPVWGDKTTYLNENASIVQPDKIYPQTRNGKKYLEVKRGGVWHTVKFQKNLTELDKYSYSYTVIRQAEDSAFMSVICKELSAPGIGSVFINQSGTVYVYNAQGKWHSTGFTLKHAKEYKVSVYVDNAAKKYKVVIDGFGEFETASVVRDGADKLVFAPQPPNNNINYIGDFKFSLDADVPETSFAADAVPFYAPVLGVPSTYRNAYAGFAAPGKVYPQTRNGKKYLEVKRGGVWHQVDFLSVLSNLDYSYSFNLLRPAANSSFIAMICADRAAPSIGSIFITQSGNISLYASDKKWKNVGIKLDANKEYKITVIVSSTKKSYKVVVDGVGEAEMTSIVRENANKLIFAPQPPDKNISYVSDLKFYYNN